MSSGMAVMGLVGLDDLSNLNDSTAGADVGF